MSHARKIAHGSISNVARVILSMLVALILPPMLVHRTQPAEYGAWVLILQCSGYFALLDLGLQTAVAKFVAECDAAGNYDASGRILSSAFALLAIAAAVGMIGVGILSLLVPNLFHQMPPGLIATVRLGILIVGSSTVFALPFGTFLGAFTGLQRYGFPTVLALFSRALSAAALIALLLMHNGLLALVWTLAAFNIATALGQFAGWHKYIRDRVQLACNLANTRTAKQLLAYGSVISLWTLAGLFISGFDTIIVGHFDFKNTGYYGLAASAVNFMLVVVGALFSPLVPAFSSLQAARTPEQIGALTVKTTRYCVLFVCAIGLPMLLGAYPLLRIWVGKDYALRTAMILQVLVVGNAIRQFGYPYSLVVIATGKQHLATIAAVSEAVVNFGVSVYLVQRIGAVGVAIGTFAGAFVSVGLHLLLSMRLTRSTITVDRRSFVLEGILRPLLCAIPLLLFVRDWGRPDIVSDHLFEMIAWCTSTALIGWFLGLRREDRWELMGLVGRLVRSH